MIYITWKINKMEIEQYMLNFIKQREGDTLGITKVLNIEIKDHDDKNGAMGEHYIVTSEIEVPTNTLTSGVEYKKIKAVCLVDVQEFKKYVSKQKSIIWL
jgi:hypothetical protein